MFNDWEEWRSCEGSPRECGTEPSRPNVQVVMRAWVRWARLPCVTGSAYSLAQRSEWAGGEEAQPHSPDTLVLAIQEKNMLQSNQGSGSPFFSQRKVCDFFFIFTLLLCFFFTFYFYFYICTFLHFYIFTIFTFTLTFTPHTAIVAACAVRTWKSVHYFFLALYFAVLCPVFGCCLWSAKNWILWEMPWCSGAQCLARQWIHILHQFLVYRTFPTSKWTRIERSVSVLLQNGEVCSADASVFGPRRDART